MGRREEREALQSTWIVYEPKTAGRPINRRDLEGVNEADRAEARLESLQQPYGFTVSRRTFLPALARAADYQPTEAAQVPMPK